MIPAEEKIGIWKAGKREQALENRPLPIELLKMGALITNLY
jgi:hypothetical protein